MTVLTDLRCPKCGTLMAIPPDGQAPVCVRCLASRPVTVAAPNQAAVEAYRQEWVRLEAEYRRTRQAYLEQKWQIIGRRPVSPRSTPYMNEAQKAQLEPYTAELVAALVEMSDRSNDLAARIDQALECRSGQDSTRRAGSFPAWPAMFANVLELEPHGAAYMDQFEPLIFELSRRDLLAPELGRIVTFWPIHNIVRSIPVLLTRNLSYGWAVEIHRELVKAGALSRLACTELVEDLAMQMHVPGD